MRTGEKRFLEMLRKYGRDDVLAAIDAIMEHSERIARERVAAMPDGVYEAESFMDDDGVTVGARVPIRVKVTVKGDRMSVDLSDVSEQVGGFYNSGVTAGLSCCQVAFKCLTSPLDMPINEGQFRALDVILPPGRVVSAVKPAAMRMWMTYPMTVVDTIFKAMSPAMPDQVAAGHHADLVVGRVNGRRAADNAFYIYLGGLIGGGWGAKHDSDGMSATIAINDGDTHNGPSEQVEAKYPLLVERYTLRPDSGGAGRYRGGLGTEQVVQALNDIRFSSQMDRVKCKPWGLDGGHSGLGNSVALHRYGKTEETHFPNGKALNQVLKPGDAYILRSGGGGGYGTPLERDPGRLEHDVRCGYVSRAAAEDVYGAVLDADGKVNAAATEKRRAEMTAQGLPIDQPIAGHKWMLVADEHVQPLDRALSPELPAALWMVNITDETNPIPVGCFQLPELVGVETPLMTACHQPVETIVGTEVPAAWFASGMRVIDIANPLDFSSGMPPTLSICNTDSLGEQIQRAFPAVKVVKTLNTMNAMLMVAPEKLAGADHSIFVSGNDAGAKKSVTDLLRTFGWKDIVDLGDISTARGTEMMLPIWLRAWNAVGSPMFSFKLVR